MNLVSGEKCLHLALPHSSVAGCNFINVGWWFQRIASHFAEMHPVSNRPR
jgi:hypothetical protein